jgi:hypothetical protein
LNEQVSNPQVLNPQVLNRQNRDAGIGNRLKRALPAAVVFLFIAGFSHAQTIVGDWLGTIQLASVELRMQLHIAKESRGGYSATLDDIDHGQNGIAVSSISFADAKLSFVANAISASYEGRVNPEGTAIEGTWAQGLSLPLTFRRLKVPLKLSHKAAKPSDIDGTWEGVIGAANGARLIFHIVNTEDGLTATVDSPGQSLSGWPVPVVTRNGSTLRLEIKQVNAVFQGKISSDLTAIDGSWETPDKHWPLVLKRVTEPKQ